MELSERIKLDQDARQAKIDEAKEQIKVRRKEALLKQKEILEKSLADLVERIEAVEAEL